MCLKAMEDTDGAEKSLYSGNRAVFMVDYYAYTTKPHGGTVIHTALPLTLHICIDAGAIVVSVA